MAIRILRIGSPRAAGEGPRIGGVRCLRRGVPQALLAEREGAMI